jgi:hypothetical protein
MRQQVLAAMAAAIVVMGSAGCKRQPPPLAVEESAPHQAKTPPGPTTQELLSGPRQRIVLDTLPLTAAIPQGWTISRPPGMNFAFLEGPLPGGGQVHIQLTKKPPLWAVDKSPMTMDERLDLMKQAAQKEQQADPQTIKYADLRSLGQAKIFEKQSVFQPAGGAAVDEKGRPVAVGPQYRWTITLFVPQDKTYQTYELNFLDLSQSQYEANRDFLQGIVDSLRLTHH